ncbi:MAG TPA: hypothetical protein VEY50_02065 [Lysobacter sp.]|nr:hypothetical protein [Lysobacter sp.]
MTDIVLPNLDPALSERIGRVAQARGWSMQQTLLHLIEQGLSASEIELKARFNEMDAQALKEAIAAMETIPDDPGFSLIGRLPKSEP